MNSFSGFRGEDFSAVDGTHWRKELGTDLIDLIGREYKSWPIYRWQGLHIGPEKNGQPRVEDAKFFVATDDQTGGRLAYGLYIECSPNPEAGTFVHWQNFREGLRDGEKMKLKLASVLAKFDLSVGKYAGDKKHDPSWHFEHRDGQFRFDFGQPNSETSIETLVERIDELPQGEWVDLYIFALMSKKTAIELKERVTDSVGKVLLALVPLYFQITSR